MTSKREIEQRLAAVEAPSVDGPDEIVITDEVVSTSWSPDEPEDVSLAGERQVRMWRDDSGEWHRELLSEWSGGD